MDFRLLAVLIVGKLVEGHGGFDAPANCTGDASVEEVRPDPGLIAGQNDGEQVGHGAGAGPLALGGVVADFSEICGNGAGRGGQGNIFDGAKALLKRADALEVLVEASLVGGAE